MRRFLFNGQKPTWYVSRSAVAVCADRWPCTCVSAVVVSAAWHRPHSRGCVFLYLYSDLDASIYLCGSCACRCKIKFTVVPLFFFPSWMKRVYGTGLALRRGAQEEESGRRSRVSTSSPLIGMYVLALRVNWTWRLVMGPGLFIVAWLSGPATVYCNQENTPPENKYLVRESIYSSRI